MADEPGSPGAASGMSPQRRTFFFWLNVAWSALSVAVLFWCANLGLNSPGRPDPASGHTFEITWRVGRVYVTQAESLLFCAGLAWMALYLAWCFFLDPLRERRRRAR